MFDWYLSGASLICFDGDELVGDPPPGDPPPGDPPGGSKTFTQEQLNKFLADDRRKTEAKYKGQLERAEKTYQEMLENKNLSDTERLKLDESLEDVRKQLRTKDQQLAHEKKQLEEQFSTKIKDSETKAGFWESRYREESITRAISDAAAKHDAFRPEQIVRELASMTKLSEITDDSSGKGTGKFKVVVDFPDLDPNTGEEVMTQRTPEEAVKRMKEKPEIYGNLFKSGVVSGIGGSSGTGSLNPGANGRVDPRKLTTDQYMKLRKENPEALGLKRRR